MKYLAVFDDGFLSNFRLDDCGLTLVLTDKAGLTRAVALKPLGKPVIALTDGQSAYITQGHIDALLKYEEEETWKSEEATWKSIMEDMQAHLGKIDEFEFAHLDKTVLPIHIKMFAGCEKCDAHDKCLDAFKEHSPKCNHYDKTEEEFVAWIKSKQNQG